ncbi:hypothetical protein ACFSJQ_22660 [Vibrio olivae]
MIKEEYIKICTFSPIRTPINTISEHRSSLNYGQHEQFKNVLVNEISKWFGLCYKKCNVGYENINHDNHPYFFQPICVSSIDLGELDYEFSKAEFFSWWDQSKLNKCEISFFDDTIAILNIEFDLLVTQHPQSIICSDLDKDLNILVKIIYERLICPKFVEISSSIDSSIHSLLINPNDFLLFDDVVFSENSNKEYILWTGRMAFCESLVSVELKKRL